MMAWDVLKTVGTMPHARSGHSFTQVGSAYVLFGGISNEHRDKPGPNNDVYTLRISSRDCTWSKEKPRGDQPLPRTQHATCEIPGDRLLVFGGYYSSSKRFNDVYILHAPTMTWSQPPGQKSGTEPTNAESVVGGPEPRASCTLTLLGSKVYVFGGFGGVGYARRAFNDILTIDLNTWQWTRIEAAGQVPEPRSGHSACVVDNKLMIFGGWSSHMQFNNCHCFNPETNEWADMEKTYGIPRWNHSAIFVEAIPSCKYFIFGGSTGEFEEGQHRSLGKLSEEIFFFDLASKKFSSIQLEDEDGLKRAYTPRPREHSTLIYDRNESRLILFGGWNNNWLGDIHALKVSKIVGPPYAVERVEPCLGPVTGMTKIIIHGVGFFDTSEITIKFICARQVLQAQGQYLSLTEVCCDTPSFENIGPKEAEIKVSFRGGDDTITSTKFSYYLNTRAHKSLAFGPGLLKGASAGVPVVFVIQARNDLGENRKSGADIFVVNLHQGEAEMACDVKDNEDGSYTCTFTPQEGEAKVDILFQNEKKELFHIRGSPFNSVFKVGPAEANHMTGALMGQFIDSSLSTLDAFLADTQNGITSNRSKNFSENVRGLLQIKKHIQDVEDKAEDTILRMDEIQESIELFVREGHIKDLESRKLTKLHDQWGALQKVAKDAKKEIAPSVANESEKCKAQIKNFENELKVYTKSIKDAEYQKYDIGVEGALAKLGAEEATVARIQDTLRDLEFLSENFGFPDAIAGSQKIFEQNVMEITNIRALWNHTSRCLKTYEVYLETPWNNVNSNEWEEDNKRLQKDLRDQKVEKKTPAYLGIDRVVKNWANFLPLITLIKGDFMMKRHWDSIRKIVKKDFPVDDRTVLRDIYALGLHNLKDQVEEVADQASQEAKMEKQLNNIETFWGAVQFEQEPHKNGDVHLLKISEENFEKLEEHQVNVGNMFASRYMAFFEERIMTWQKTLNAIYDVSGILSEVEHSWNFLETLFIHSEEVKKELPAISEEFVEIDRDVKAVLQQGSAMKLVRDFCVQKGIMKQLEEVKKKLDKCERALNEFLDGKRRAFPRFYFVSTTDLLDILSNGNNPKRIMKHMSKVFQSIQELELQDAGDRPSANTMISCVGIETVKFSSPLKLLGKVENYLSMTIDAMRSTLRDIAQASLTRFQQKPREEWLVEDPSQITLLINLIDWVVKTESAFRKLNSGDAKALDTAHKAQVIQLTSLVKMVQGKLDRPVRTKVMCLITMDTHSRDILEKLQKEGVVKPDEFQWQSQLKAYWDTGKNNCNLQVCDATLWYGYEYLGNGPRLVVTPLTDRIYVTATQALHLKMGCAPAGPAGTGKTETTKDLSSAAGKACYVFNCSDQMDYRSMGDIFKGLASSGSWGCFDEFNRLEPAVLSVCSVQFKSVTDAIKAQQQRFSIQGDEISLDPSCGVFITMNPGYLGRSELPEGLKALFRPITVVVPDLELICENMLMAEGFVDAKILARKFTVLYSLCADLLSKQRHYDWGLRAIKSVLVVAGGFKRTEPDLLEQALLMRALRDFNLPKIVEEDLDIFMGLLGDLFPGINVPPKRDLQFEEVIASCLLDAKLDPEPEVIKKVVQLNELLEIRHCVFIIGSAGAGKSTAWKMLAKSNDKIGKKTTAADLNPKAISTNELYGYIVMSTREWKDGILSKTMRSLGEVPDTNPKWIILDGDLDANWIESMNSVMDDNKILTLASNERIPLKAHMRNIYEIRDLVFASPATVSRAGILFISHSKGYQWKSYFKAWVARTYPDQPDQKPSEDRKEEKKEDLKEKLQTLFDRYIAKTLKYLRKNAKYVVPVVEINLVISLCNLLEGLLPPDTKAVEYWFVFCSVWAVGGCLAEKDGIDYRKSFSNWWKGKWKTIKFPGKGSIFDYYFKPEDSKFDEWVNKVETIEFEAKDVNNVMVPTPETVSNSYFMKGLIKKSRPVLVIGSAGCGKTQLCKGVINSMDKDEFCYNNMNFNYYTDAILLQTILEQPPLAKKAGRQYSPPGKLRLIYYIDDMNMPMLDPYNTQSAIELLRQHADYQHWYDRSKLTIKEILNTLFVASMNPTAGSFFVNPRFQRHFWILAISFPETSSLFTIYNAFATGHFGRKGFKSAVQEITSHIIKAAVSFHPLMVASFRKTAINFHYEFSVRHLSYIFQGILIAQPTQFGDPEKLVKLWVHESERIYGDRLINAEHLYQYKQIMGEHVKKTFGKYNLAKYFLKDVTDPLIFCNFAKGLSEKNYDQVTNMEDLSRVLSDALKEYNETNAIMDLVLFEDAMKHVCRISRIIANPQGHALLVGVGGSGKQSLSRLASFICGFQTVQITISQSYSMNDLKTDLQMMYQKAGVKDDGLLFLLTEGQIANERFLVYINDLLSSGEIADLYTDEEKDPIVTSIRSAVKAAGVVDNKENSWNFFIGRIKTNLHMALCFSPVGDNFRNKAKKFPALVNCTVIDWFQDWPQEALTSVAGKFLHEVELGLPEVREGVVRFMPYSFKVVNESSVKYKELERRFCYTTPKSFLELIKLFVNMLDRKRTEITNNKERLETGLIKLIETGEMVEKLQEDLNVKQVVVEEKKKAAEEFAAEVGVEKAKVAAESDKANVEAENCERIQVTVERQKADCESDLEKALPLVEKAEEALNTLQKKDFDEVKALKSPPPGLDDITAAVLILNAGIMTDVIVTDKQGNVTDKTWKAAQKMMSNPAQFLERLKGYKAKIDLQEVPAKNFKAIRPLLALEHFNRDAIKNKSKACAGLCEWVINIVKYYDVFSEVEPKREALRQATQQLQEANEKLQQMKELVAELEVQLSELVARYETAMKEKQDVENEALRCQTRLDLAKRLVRALGSEKDRWAESIERFRLMLEVLVGDVLISSAFVSYIGCFTKQYRDDIVNHKFLTFLREKNIPMSPNPNPVALLTSPAVIAKWNNQKLPTDPVSIENGAILTNTERYPLIIDPQLQGISWLREKEAENKLKIGRLSNMKQLISFLEQSIDNGWTVIIENIEETIDAVISPVVARNTIKRGRNKLMKLGEKEIPLHPNFRLYLHTKLSNPHYPPEIQAETALINFTVTQSGLEDQLLSLVVKKERPGLARQKEELIQQQNEFKIKLKELEDDLLYRLTNAKGDILEDIALIENLERSKQISDEVKEKMAIAEVTEKMIIKTSEEYRPAAARGALTFFLMNELYKIHHFYRFSLESYLIVVTRAIDLVAAEYRKQKSARAAPAEEGKAEGGEPPAEAVEQAPAQEEEERDEEFSPRSLKKRVADLTESITFQSFTYTRRGLFEKHKLIVATMLCFRILVKSGAVDPGEYVTLIQAMPSLEPGHKPDSLNFLTDFQWAVTKNLDQTVPALANVCASMETEYLQWRKWFNEEKAEIVDLPRNFKELSSFHKMLLLRAMRADRLTTAMNLFVREQMGERYVEQMPFNMVEAYAETTKATPVFFVLFPGVDPTPDVEHIGADHGISGSQGNFINISMGQGQEKFAEDSIEKLAATGGWIMLQNLHLMQQWLKTLENCLEKAVVNGKAEFRCFLSSEPPALPNMPIVPESILQNCIKVANEAPQDLKANIRRAYAHFSQETLDHSSKTTDFKALLFGLCVFHALMLGRRKFGSQGWSKQYSFNDGDLTICGDILHNYLERYEKVPYDDLRYLYGEIMYGGHITDGWDRRTCNTYLKVVLRPELLSGMNLVQGYKSPDPARFDYEAYRRYIEEKLPMEAPMMFGLHPNAEINYLTSSGEMLFSTIIDVQGGAGGAGTNRKAEDIVNTMITLYLGKLPNDFNMMEIVARAKEKKPEVIVCFQECERMNVLLGEIRRSLTELQLGLGGALNITESMEALGRALSVGRVPANWEGVAYWSKKLLAPWFDDLQERVKQLEEWSKDLVLPKSLWIAGLFNPMSFLTAVMQTTARSKALPLDNMTLMTSVTNFLEPTEIQNYPDNGAFVHGFFMEGAAWELGHNPGEEGYLTDSTLKDLHPRLPIVNVMAVPLEEKSMVGQYQCPVYVTSMRGPTYVFTANTRMESEESDPNKWILAGVALLMSDD